MTATNRSYFSQIAARATTRGIALIATLGAVGLVSMGGNARADVAGVETTNSHGIVVHQMVFAPVWSLKSGSAPFVTALVAKSTTQVTASSASSGKVSARDTIDIPIWPVTPPPAPNDPDDGSDNGDGSGG